MGVVAGQILDIVPAAVVQGFRVDDEEPAFIGNGVHVGDEGDAGPAARAAVQHHHQRGRLLRIVGGVDEDFSWSSCGKTLGALGQFGLLVATAGEGGHDAVDGDVVGVRKQQLREVVHGLATARPILP